ncbi:phenol hydroxylase [Tothia fuscella]|uniref:Phenol hydroxylase n=1 Tax=Tothia fuscella TaxID=1048955 RepID=A0A9P4NK26_9PEZI|nr:phenol hydroxylase [Tothia fuscella]
MAAKSNQESQIDVLIIGAGPAGLMAATWMARLGVSTRVIDKKGTKIYSGQADGLQCRSLEIFDSFGFADRVWKESNHMLEICMWNPDDTGVIRRSDRIPDTVPGLSRFQQCVLHQGRIERFFLDHMKKHSDITVERGVLPIELSIDESCIDDLDAYPITVNLRHLSDEEAKPAQQGHGVQDGLFRSNMAEDDTEDLIRTSREDKEEIVRAKYVIGCDGAHSWTRKQIGGELEGEPTDFIWGVLDIVPITDFPDIRMRCAIHSANNGALMVIPREHSLVRLYTQLSEIKPDASGRADRSKITPEVIIAAAQKTLAPYKITYKYCDWFTAYQIGQRVGNTFSKFDRVFLAGDACHTHSPKAGQGMNVSMQDTYNLGWKIGLVARGICDKRILATYEAERREVAKALIAFDHKFSRLFSGRPARNVIDEQGVSMDEFKRVFEKGNIFASGLSVEYENSMIVQAKRSNQALATNIKLGMRFPSYQVLNQADARPWPFQEWMKSDGRFRVILFAGNYRNKQQRERVQKFCQDLEAKGSFLRRVTPGNSSIDSVIEIFTLHSAPRREVEFFDFPDLLHPFDEQKGWNYNKIFVDDESYHEGHGKAYEGYGVDPERGCLVVLRPDQYVAFVGEIDDTASVEEYFNGLMLDGSNHRNKKMKRKQK